MPSTSLAESRYVLTIACIDRPGIVAAVTGYLYEAGGNILEAHCRFHPDDLGQATCQYPVS